MFHRPRGIVAYDVASQSKRWYYATGAWPVAVFAADVDGDGRDEAVVAANATQNGIADNGASDARSWVIVLDDTGRRRWQVALGADASHVQLLILPGASGREPRIVASVYNHDGENPPPSRLVVLEPRTGTILHERTFPHRIGQPHLLDAVRGTFVLGGADGVLRSFDVRLESVATGRVGGHVAAWGAVDLLANGSPCVLASTGRDALVLDERLRAIGRHRLRSDSAREPVELRAARAGLSRWRACTVLGPGTIMDLVPVASLADGPRLAGVAGAAALAGLVAAAWSRRPRRLPPMSQAREFLVDYRQVRHDVFDEVRPFGRLWNWAHESVAGAPPPAGVFEQACTEYLALGEGALRRFADRARELWVDDAVVRRIRDRLDALAAALRGVGPAAGDVDRARAVAEAMRELSDACAAAYREVATRESCRADDVVFTALAAKRLGLATRGVAVELRIEPGGAVPVLFGADDLRSIVSQLLENAAVALRGHDAPHVRLTVEGDRHDSRRVLVRVEDNGLGIPPTDRERVFRPDVSSREGGGFGLGHARETARGWRGDVVIEDAAWGPGAALVVVLARLLPFEEHP
jgi:signal transduction histidine kinase